MAEMLTERLVGDPHSWLTFVPSERQPTLVPDYGARLADRLQIPVHDIIGKTRTTAPQSTMNNSTTQVSNIWGAFELRDEPPAGRCLLLDDIIDSKWTMTVVVALLAQAGAGPVTPVALGYAGKSG
jgi:ATP-dependent DNA helicase RecQ